MGECQITAVLEAVADPTRRAILDLLRTSEARVTDLASRFTISLNSTSRHIKVLESAHLVHREVRGREHVISLRAEPLEEAAAWLSQYQEFWEDRLEALEAWVDSESLADVAPTENAAAPKEGRR